ncbi:4-sulfomuconolactone hydrolase [Paramyrothecium foliicola]|nr:4-sulfomuconolactone hydrolase [Paramyrothecium foliicola]
MVVPPGAWDCHVHCFNPELHPFKDTRTYTPQAAPLSSLYEKAQTGNIMIVQATIEDGPSGLLNNLVQAGNRYPDKHFRGTILADPEPGRELSRLQNCQFDRFHNAGVRSIRIHGSYGGNGNNLTWVLNEFRRAARLYPVTKYGWSISAQLPLNMWAKLGDVLLHDDELAGIHIIADHNGSATPQNLGEPELETFVGLMIAGKLSVKIGALHRRSPGNVAMMEPVIKMFADKAPRAIVWGSDWPHVDTTAQGPIPAPPLAVDSDGELQLLREWLSDSQWNKLMVENPSNLYAP